MIIIEDSNKIYWQNTIFEEQFSTDEAFYMIYVTSSESLDNLSMVNKQTYGWVINQI